MKDIISKYRTKIEKELKGIYKKGPKLLVEPISHVFSGKGKRIRPLLTLGCAKLCGYEDGERDIILASCVELIHNATLLHDDVIDKSNLRRGIKTSNAIWGNQSSILVGDYLLSRCFEMMVNDGSLEVLQLLSSTSSI